MADGEELWIIPLEKVLLSKKNRKALKRDRGQIDRMRQEIEAGREMLPIRVNALCDGTFQLVDGRHRFLAAELAGEVVIEAYVTKVVDLPGFNNDTEGNGQDFDSPVSFSFLARTF